MSGGNTTNNLWRNFLNWAEFNIHLPGNVISRNKREVNRCEGIKTVKHLPMADRHPFKCDKFIECAHGQEIEKSCNDSMHWSISKNACVDPDEGDCIPEWEFGKNML